MSLLKWKLLDRWKWLFLPCLILAMTTVVLQPVPLSAAQPPAFVKAPPTSRIGIVHAAGEVLVKFRQRPSTSEAAAIHATMGAEVISTIPVLNVQRVRGVRGQTADELMDTYANRPDVDYVEPNGIVHTTLTPNDPYFSLLYGLHNTGQTGGTADADIDAPEAWDLQTGSANVIVADIDSGVDYNHQDLSANMWTNTGEIPGNGIDDDGNGYIDDVRGWDFINNDNDPMDDSGHGTHTAGTIAAVGNNGVGITGVSWHASIMPLKFIDASGSGTFEAAASAIIYSADMGARLSSNSWGCGPGPACFSQVIEDAIAYANSRDALFVTAAGNDNTNNDVTGFYPCASGQPNVICVAATDHKDQKAVFSNYGRMTVDIGAPGAAIYSTVPTGSCQWCDASGYKSLNGTSMATPHVSGAAALLLSLYPNITPQELRSVILGTSDPIPALTGKTLSGGRLNVNKALSVNFTVDVTPASQELLTGGSTTYTVNVVSLNNFNAPVTLGLVSPVPSITGAFSVNPITPPSNSSSSSVLTIFTTDATERGTYNLTIEGTDTSGKTGSAQAVLQVIPDVDLVMSEVSTTSSSVYIGGSLNITNTVTNQGNVSATDPFYAGLYLSTDPVITTYDVYLTSRLVNSLAAGANDTAITNVTVPSNLSSGIYYVGAIADIGSSQMETDETNNTIRGQTIKVNDFADLLMTEVSTTATNITPGSSITIGNTVMNQGTGASGYFYVSLYLSADVTITTGDMYLGVRYVDSLAAGAGNSAGTTVNLPGNLTSGDYYTGAIADAFPYSLIVEDDESNNAIAGNTITVIASGAEVCDGMDNDQNGMIDEGVQNTYYQDADYDTIGNPSVTTQACTPPSGYVSNNMDCDDADASIYPGATEVPNDGIDQDCNGFDLAVEVLTNGATGNQQAHTVAWNQDVPEYLVLWQDFRNGAGNSDIYGARLDKNGNVVVGDLPVVTQTAKQAGPWVSYGGGGYIAVWIDQRMSSTTGTDVYGAWILPDGTVSSEFVVTNTTANQRAASVIYNPTANNFLVTWTDDSSGASDVNIWGAVVNPGGGVSSGPFAMVTSAGNQRGPYVRYDYGNNRYFMVWFDNSSWNNDVYGSRVSASGTLLDGSGLVISNASGNQNNPRITDRDPYSGISNFVLSWIDLRNGQADIYGALIDEFGTKIGSDIQIAGGSYDQRASSIDVDYIRTGQAVVSWIDKRNGTDFDIYRAQVDQSGVVSGEALVAGAATGAANNQQGPLVSYSDDGGVDNGFLFLWRDNRSGVDYDMYGIKVWP